mmetsp:Transcript_22580/g.77733  ORF Transcript_22580/g.77733 Transcript_22580/m.77733 type:complete len:224 (-) Transcript_22580:290-961(-)
MSPSKAATATARASASARRPSSSGQEASSADRSATPNDAAAAASVWTWDAVRSSATSTRSASLSEASRSWTAVRNCVYPLCAPQASRTFFRLAWTSWTSTTWPRAAPAASAKRKLTSASAQPPAVGSAKRFLTRTISMGVLMTTSSASECASHASSRIAHDWRSFMLSKTMEPRTTSQFSALCSSLYPPSRMPIFSERRQSFLHGTLTAAPPLFLATARRNLS